MKRRDRGPWTKAVQMQAANLLNESRMALAGREHLTNKEADLNHSIVCFLLDHTREVGLEVK